MSRLRMSVMTMALLGWLGASLSPSHAEDFGDITAAAQSFHSGDTFHGYCEFRVSLENRSSTYAHTVTLVFPDHPWTSGNGLSRLGRTFTMAPGAKLVVPLWQPPLPAYGDGTVRIDVDDSRAGAVTLPNSGRHMSRTRGYGSGADLPVILISRSLDFDGLNASFGGTRSGYTSEMAMGVPDTVGRSGFAPTAWSPNSTALDPQWLELDYAKLQPVDCVRIYTPITSIPTGDLVLKNAAGTNIYRVSLSTAARKTSPIGGGRRRFVNYYWELTLPRTAEPVKTVRLDFGPGPVNDVAIDAVELVNGLDGQWATAARASSDTSASPPTSSGSETVECLRAELPVGEWSEHWLAYSAYDAIALTATELKTMPPGAALAVWRYVEAGGNLFLFGGQEIPEPWRTLAKNGPGGDEENAVGFGRCFLLPGGSSKGGLDSALTATLVEAAKETVRYWLALPSDNYRANSSFPVVENLRVPVRGMVIIMLLFIIIIGPVNLLVLTRMRRRTWMLWTIPATSMVTCLLVFVYSLLSEGVRPSLRLESVTLLDQVNRRATSLAAAAFYCPLTPGQGLRFGFETEATPLVELNSYNSGGTAREVDWTQTQHFRRGWVSARVPALFHVRKSETQRERLQVEEADGVISVINGLGAPVLNLWLADRAGRVYSATNVPAGQKARLQLVQNKLDRESKTPVSALFLKNSYGAAATTLADKPLDYLVPGTYVAELGENPFVEKALGPKVKAKKSRERCLVYGILDNSATFATQP